MSKPDESTNFVERSSEVGQLILARDWSKHTLGRPEGWPTELKTSLSLILNSQFPMFISWGSERTFFYNDAYIPILGAKHPTALGRKFEIIWSEIWKDLDPIVQKVEEGKGSFFEDLPLYMNRKGEFEQTYFTFSYSPVKSANGQVLGLYCACVETTKRIEAETQLKKAHREAEADRAELVDTLESMSDAFFSIDKNWVVTRVNEQHEKLVHKSREEQVGKNFIELWFNDPKYEDSLYLKSYRRAMKERVVVTFEDYYDPLNFWTEVRVYPKSDGGIAVFFTDITARKKAEEALKKSEQNFRALFQSAPGLYLVLDPDLVISASSDAYNVATLTKREDMLGRNIFDVFPDNPEDPQTPGVSNLRTSLNYVLKSKLPHSMALQKYDVRDSKGNWVEKWWSPINSPVLGPNGEVVYIIHRVEDVTEYVHQQLRDGKEPAIADGATQIAAELFQRAHDIQDTNLKLQGAMDALIKSQDELRRAKEEAEHANDLKSAFLANMSHEIRTPLGAMMGFADLLKDPGLTLSERQSFTNILTRNGESLSVIINDILDLSKVEAGHLNLEFTDTYPDQIGADVVSLLRVKANEKDLVLEYSHDETSPESVVADPTRVRQILLNLVGNAIKFTQFGSVKLRSFSCKSARGRHALCFEVTDTGIGIAKDQQEKIFDLFVQADNSMTRRFGGTGLGLALSRHLARGMGGDIVVTSSEEEVGSTFLLTIEDQPEKRNDNSVRSDRPSNQIQELPDKALSGVKILVVDDAPDNQQLIWRYLTKQGALVTSAENGLIGYRTAISGNFDLVLMDIQMPVMDGYSATQKLREAGYRKPIVALTAHAMSEVRKKALNVGYTDHLTKPINPKELVATMARYVGAEQP